MATHYHIPVWATVGKSYRLALSNSGEFLRIARWWLLIAVIAMTGYNYFTWPIVNSILCFVLPLHDQAKMHEMVLNSTIALLPISLIYLFAGASIAVAWHRLILRGERIDTGIYLRCDRVVAAYFGYGFFLLALQKIPTLINMLSDPSAVGLNTLVSLIASVLSLFISFYVIRVTPIFPAIALANPLTLKEVWNRTRSNFWRLFLGTLLCILPGMSLLIITFATKLIYGDAVCMEQTTGPLLYAVANIISLLLMLPVLLSYLSLTYQYFFEEPQSTH